jgi:salicylate hydroxylase
VYPRLDLLITIKVGAGIQIPPNSSRLLHDWGLGPRLDAATVHPGAMILRRWEDGRPIGFTDVGPKFRSMFHAPYYVIHRANFHEILHARAHELGVEVKLGSKVEIYDADVPSVTLENGQVLTADLIIAADGEIALPSRY